MILRHLSFLLVGIVLMGWASFDVYAAPQTYEEYKKEADKYCDGQERTWSTAKSLVPKINYSELSSAGVNNTLRTWRSGGLGVSEDEKSRLMRDLDPVKIGEYRGFKTLEIARIGYRTRMNTLFSCAVIGSRIDTLVGLEKLISTKFRIKNSEIREKLKKDTNKLSQVLNNLKCNIPKSSESQEKGEMIISLTNSASYQYCGYRHYLSYLESNIDDIPRLQTIESKIGQGEGTTQSATIAQWASASDKYQKDISTEIIRADTTIPKAIRAFVEMDQTYGAHILLVLIYDDYIRLRKALSSYMNLSSQIYQKANNAQSTNK